MAPFKCEIAKCALPQANRGIYREHIRDKHNRNFETTGMTMQFSSCEGNLNFSQMLIRILISKKYLLSYCT